jgi:hypothetical protein
MTIPMLEKLRILKFILNSRQTMGAKVRSQEGNSPDYLLRSLNYFKVIKRV